MWQVRVQILLYLEIKCQLDATDDFLLQILTDNLKIKALNTTGNNLLYNTVELLMMGIMVPETC